MIFHDLPWFAMIFHDFPMIFPGFSVIFRDFAMIPLWKNAEFSHGFCAGDRLGGSGWVATSGRVVNHMINQW